MALTRHYEETVAARLQRDRKFAWALYAEALNALLNGGTAEALPMKRPSFVVPPLGGSGVLKPAKAGTANGSGPVSRSDRNKGLSMLRNFVHAQITFKELSLSIP